MNNEKNMGPVQSSDEARKRGRNGGIASGKSRRRKKEVRERLKEALNCAVVNPKVKSMMKQVITPAYAGKTSKCHARSLKNRDHPRVCGENMLSMSEPILFAGSPPRMRGKPSLGTAYASGQGITPAHAGKTAPH